MTPVIKVLGSLFRCSFVAVRVLTGFSDTKKPAEAGSIGGDIGMPIAVTLGLRSIVR